MGAGPSRRPNAPPQGEERVATIPRTTKQATRAASSLISLSEGFFYTVIEEASSDVQVTE